MMLPLTPEGGVSRERCRSYDRSAVSHVLTGSVDSYISKKKKIIMKLKIVFRLCPNIINLVSKVVEKSELGNAKRY